MMGARSVIDMRISGIIIGIVVIIALALLLSTIKEYFGKSKLFRMIGNVINENEAVLKGTIDIFFILVLLFVIFLCVITPKVLQDNISETNGSDIANWLSFYGSYLGGIFGGIIAGTITLFVLKKTVESNQKTNALQILPCFSVDVTVDGNGSNGLYGVPYMPKKRFFRKNTYYGISDSMYILKLKNIGVGAALNVNLKKIYTDQEDYYIECERPLVEKYMVAQGMEMELRVNLCVDDKYDIRYWFFVVAYEDILGHNYEQVIYYPLNLLDRIIINSPKQRG